MASQPLYQPLRPMAPPAPRVDIRVAFSGSAAVATVGTAVEAVRRTLATIPVQVRDATMDELVMGQLAAETISLARGLLSPPVYAAFLAWGSAAVRFAVKGNADDGNCKATYAAIEVLAAAPAITLHDLALKTWILNLEVSDAPNFGVVRMSGDGQLGINTVMHAVQTDLLRLSPLIVRLEVLARRGQELSGSTWDLSPMIGEAIASAFDDAAGETTAPDAAPAAWGEAITAYLAAQSVSDATSVEDPGVDKLVDAYCEAMDHLIERVRAPNVEAIALKIALAEGRADGFDCVLFDEHVLGLIADVKHLAGVSVAPRRRAAHDDQALAA